MEHTARMEIYEDLFRSSNLDPFQQTPHSPIPLFTKKELDKAMGQLRQGKAPVGRGTSCEMIKNSCTSILQPSAQPPETMKNTTITVITSSIDLAFPANYRPICTIPMLCTLSRQPPAACSRTRSKTQKLTKQPSLPSRGRASTEATVTQF